MARWPYQHDTFVTVLEDINGRMAILPQWLYCQGGCTTKMVSLQGGYNFKVLLSATDACVLRRERSAVSDVCSCCFSWPACQCGRPGDVTDPCSSHRNRCHPRHRCHHYCCRHNEKVGFFKASYLCLSQCSVWQLWSVCYLNSLFVIVSFTSFKSYFHSCSCGM